MRFSVVTAAPDPVAADALRRQTHADFEVLPDAAHAGGDVVAFLGEGAIPDPRWLEELADAYADQAVAGVGGVVVDPTGSGFRHRFAACDRRTGAWQEVEPPFTPYLLPGADPFLVLHATNASFRREHLPAGVGTPVIPDLCRRLIDGGHRLVSLDGAAVFLSADDRPAVARGELPHHIPDRRLTVCFVSRDGPPDLARDLAAEGHEIRVVAHASGGTSVRLEEGVWVHRVPTQSTGGWDRPDIRPAVRDALGWAAAAHAAVKRIAATRPVDLISAPVAGCEGLFCLLDDDLTTVLTLGTTLRAAADADAPRLLDPALPDLIALERLTLRHARHLIAPTRAAFTLVERDYGFPATGTVIPPGVADPPPLDSKGEDGTVRVLAVGHPGRAGGTDLFLTAVGELGPEFPTAEFVVAPADPAELAACDIVCLPARSEAAGSPAIDAMAFGKPVVAAAVGGLAEVVCDGETGYLAYPGSSDSLAAHLRPLLASRDLRNRFGAAGRRRYEALFRREVVVRETVRAYTTMAGA